MCQNPTSRCEPVNILDRPICALVSRARSSGLSGKQMATYSIKRCNFICLVSGITRPLRARSRICLAHFQLHLQQPQGGTYASEPFGFGHHIRSLACHWRSYAASANVITDWDEKAVAVVMPGGPVGVSQQVYTAQRMMGMVHAAMFDAVNSIERRYQPYLVQLPADPATSKEAAAAAAAAAVLATIDEKTAGERRLRSRPISRRSPMMVQRKRMASSSARRLLPRC
jgi:hypothetical protein